MKGEKAKEQTKACQGWLKASRKTSQHLEAMLMAQPLEALE